MWTFVLIFIGMLALSTFTTWFAIRLKIMDAPNERKIHEKITPRAGGIGIFIPFVFGLAVYSLIYGDVKFAWISAFTFILMLIGLVDDKIELNAKLKLVLQLAVIICTVFIGVSFDKWGWLNYPLTFFWFIGMINAVNLIDGLDGLAAGVSITACLGLGIIGYIYNLPILLAISAFLAVSCFGFMVFNYHPAKIFMGDAGSIPLGYILSVAGIIVANNTSGSSLDIGLAVLILMAPLYDTFVAVIRRLINKRPLFKPDRSHTYNLLMDKHGLSHGHTVIVVWIFNLINIAVAFVYLSMPSLQRIILIVAWTVILIAIAVFLRFFETEGEKVQSSSGEGIQM